MSWRPLSIGRQIDQKCFITLIKKYSIYDSKCVNYIRQNLKYLRNLRGKMRKLHQKKICRTWSTLNGPHFILDAPHHYDPGPIS
jgi:hypothetical protein